ncbi:MAG: chromosomal replication initiator protein DnaA, partial [Polyangiaceae bacterium]|nr:chromosomal replication initiator protein DnaA [Polyangiaceae bacterium]
MPRLSSPQAFDEAVAYTRSLSPATFDTWFAGVQFDDLTDGVLTLRAANEFVQEWIELNFLPTLTARLRELTEKSVQVVWLLDPQLPRPIAVGPTVTPVRPRTLHLRPSDAPPISTAEPPRSVPQPARAAHCVNLVDLNPKQ